MIGMPSVGNLLYSGRLWSLGWYERIPMRNICVYFFQHPLWDMTTVGFFFHYCHIPQEMSERIHTNIHI